MLMKLTEWVAAVKGGISRTHYARACKWDPSYVIVQCKPEKWDRKDYKKKDLPTGAQKLSHISHVASQLYKAHRAELEAEVQNIRKGKSRNKEVRSVATAWSLAIMIASGKYPDITSM